MKSKKSHFRPRNGNARRGTFVVADGEPANRQQRRMLVSNIRRGEKDVVIDPRGAVFRML